MPTTTKHALPYPAPGDPVNQGAANFQSLANALDVATLVPAGGAAGSYLAKSSATDFACGWTPLGGGWVPAGGATGQVLTKTGSADFASAWQTPTGGGGGGGIFWVFPPVTVANADGTALTQLASLSVAAGTLGTNKKLRIMLRGDRQNVSVGTTMRFTFSYGTVTFLDFTTGNATTQANRAPWFLNFELSAVGAASQYLHLDGWLATGASTQPTTGRVASSANMIAAPYGSNGLIAVDSTVTQSLLIFMAHGTANATTDFRMHHGLAELVG